MLLSPPGGCYLIQLPANLALRQPPPARHYSRSFGDTGQVLQRVAFHQNQISAFTGRDSSEAVPALEIVPDIFRTRMNDLVRSEPAFPHHRHLAMDREARNAELLRR